MLGKANKIFIAGHNGLVGSAFLRYFKAKQFKNIIIAEKKDLDLTNKEDVNKFFLKNKPEFVILAAGKTGGILENLNNPLNLMLTNMEIQINVINSSINHKIKKLVFFGSTCMYPSKITGLLEEDMLLSGKPESSSLSYAMAKLSGLQLCLTFNEVVKQNILLPLIPNSIYGPNDNFNLLTGHVLSSLIQKFHEAKIENKEKVILWGSGKPKREFIFVDDLVEACILVLNKSSNKINFPINLGSGEEFSIKNLAEIIKKIVNFKGKILWDKSKPDGVNRKVLSLKRIKSIGWSSKTDIFNGIKQTYEWYRKNNI